jgi:hypothetical protein
MLTNVKTWSGAGAASMVLVMLAAVPGFVATEAALQPSLAAVVIDAATRLPVADAMVTVDGVERRSDADGRVLLPVVPGAPIRARAIGYGRAQLAAGDLRGSPPAIVLTPLAPKAAYLSVYGIGSRALREPVLQLIETTELNAVVVDVKGDRGLLPYPSQVMAPPSARTITTVPDLAALVRSLHEHQIYAIARIVVFKDEPLAAARPELAIRRRDGSVYRDRENLAWTSPAAADVRRYNLGVAREAAAAGFDEIQFDYVRLPDATGLELGFVDDEEHRVAAIDTFLEEARRELTPFNVFIAADIFGYVCWNQGDTRIGQQLDHLLARVDYLSPMLYPSSFQFGIPDCRNPVEHPYEIVRRSLANAIARTRVPARRFRPWLQAFRDYAFGAGAFTSGEVREQIRAAEELGTTGWMLWNPQNRYSRADLLPAEPGPR